MTNLHILPIKVDKKTEHFYFSIMKNKTDFMVIKRLLL